MGRKAAGEMLTGATAGNSLPPGERQLSAQGLTVPLVELKEAVEA